MRFAATVALLLMLIIVGTYTALTRTAIGQDWVLDSDEITITELL